MWLLCHLVRIAKDNAVYYIISSRPRFSANVDGFEVSFTKNTFNKETGKTPDEYSAYINDITDEMFAELQKKYKDGLMVNKETGESLTVQEYQSRTQPVSETPSQSVQA